MESVKHEDEQVLQSDPATPFRGRGAATPGVERGELRGGHRIPRVGVCRLACFQRTRAESRGILAVRPRGDAAFGDLCHQAVRSMARPR